MLRIVVRGWATPFVLFFNREVTEWHTLDVDAERLGLVPVARNGLRVGRRSSVLAVCYALVMDRASGAVVTWPWEWSRETAKNGRKTVVSPRLPLIQREDASSVSSRVVRKSVVYAVVFVDS